jgi:hypothetical protein
MASSLDNAAACIAVWMRDIKGGSAAVYWSGANVANYHGTRSSLFHFS